MNKFLCILSCILLLSLLGCGNNTSFNMRDGYYNTEDNIYYLFNKIETIPDDWTEAEFNDYYYQVDTNVVYIGTNNLSSQCATIIKLESEEYDKYIYDKENNKFIGIK